MHQMVVQNIWNNVLQKLNLNIDLKTLLVQQRLLIECKHL